MKLLILGMFVFGFSFMMNAQTQTPEIRKTQVKHHKRVVHGVKTGTLTEREAATLQRKQDSVTIAKKKAKSDGVVTKKERAKIQARQAKLGKEIYLKKNNKITR